MAEAQLTNVTRQKLKEAYDLHTAAVIERAEKQILLARQARKLIDLLDDTPVVPGDERQPYAQGEAAREILNDAEKDLREWEPSHAPISSNAQGLGVSAVPQGVPEHHEHDEEASEAREVETPAEERVPTLA